MAEERKANHVRWFLRAFPLTFCASIAVFIVTFTNLSDGARMRTVLVIAVLGSLIVGFTQLRESLKRVLSGFFGHFFWAALGLCTAPLILVIWTAGASILSGRTVDDDLLLRGFWVMFAGSFPSIFALFMGFLAGAVVVLLYRFISSGLKSRKKA